MSSRRSAQPRQAERPEVDAGEQIVAEAARPSRRRPDRGSCRQSAGSRSRPPCRCPAGRKRFSSSARSSIACSSRPSSPTSSRKSTPSFALSSSPGRSRTAPVNAPLHVAEEGRHGRVAADRRAVHLDERPLDADAALFFSSKMRRASSDLPAPVGPSSRIGRRRSHRHAVEPLHDLVEGGAARLDAGLEERRARPARRARSASRSGRTSRDRDR